MRAKIFLLIPLLIALVAVNAQSPAQVIVQPANQAAVPAAARTAGAADAQSIPGAIKLLEQIKAANDEVLAKQKAALEKLDEIQDAADQLRIFSKRG